MVPNLSESTGWEKLEPLLKEDQRLDTEEKDIKDKCDRASYNRDKILEKLIAEYIANNDLLRGTKWQFGYNNACLQVRLENAPALYDFYKRIETVDPSWSAISRWGRGVFVTKNDVMIGIYPEDVDDRNSSSHFVIRLYAKDYSALDISQAFGFEIEDSEKDIEIKRLEKELKKLKATKRKVK
jgi:hypothetical protein